MDASENINIFKGFPIIIEYVDDIVPPQDPWGGVFPPGPEGTGGAPPTPPPSGTPLPPEAGGVNTPNCPEGGPATAPPAGGGAINPVPRPPEAGVVNEGEGNSQNSNNEKENS